MPGRISRADRDRRQTTVLNGIDTKALTDTMQAIKADHARGIARFSVTTAWRGGTVTETSVKGWSLGGQDLPKDFTIRIDEPAELLGTNTAANPQEYLMAAMNACMAATYVAACAMQGITLEHVEIETHGDLDLRGFLGLNAAIPAGYEGIDYTVRIKGDGTEQQFRNVHEWVRKTSPNYYNLANAIQLNSKLHIE